MKDFLLRRNFSIHQYDVIVRGLLPNIELVAVGLLFMQSVDDEYLEDLKQRESPVVAFSFRVTAENIDRASRQMDLFYTWVNNQ